MVSVIVPNYNHEAYLELRLESVLNQTYSNTEIIILDDCSTDKSREVIEMYRGHPKVSHILYNDTNSGSTFKQWKKGIELAKGELIWIAESDDCAETHFLSTLAENMSKETRLAYCKSNIIDENGKNLTFFSNGFVPPFKNEIKLGGIDFAKTYMLKSNSIPNASAVLFRKEIVDSAIFDVITKTKLIGDWLFWLHLMREGEVYFSNMVLNNYRFHTNTVRSRTHNSERRILEYIFLAKTIKKQPYYNTDVIDHILFLYLSNEIKFNSISFWNHIQINFFIFRNCPMLYTKTIFKKLTNQRL